ncbi:MAG: cytochrome b/b6 domain-containing protein [Alphaproteobacteria bacterium]|nr:cytochrome b/b6 domain-containing protein [Alphaproteobacteria bacterium]
MGADAKDRAARIWDLPTRAMHWLLVISIGVCWWTGTHNNLDYHIYSGYAALWIVLMRIYWGFAGSSTALFKNFVRGPSAILAYVRTLHWRNTPHTPGHNPLGALSVLALLGMVLTVVVQGLFAVDVDGLYSGPMSLYVTFKKGRHLAHLHYQWFEYLLWVIGLHLAAVAFYYIHKRHNLVAPMISGKAQVEAEMQAAPLWRFVLGAVIVSALVWAISKGFYIF